MSAALLTAQGIKKSYLQGEKKLEVLRGIDLALPAGSFWAVVGPSGSGKSTLLHLFGGLDRPSEGVIQCEGRDFWKISSREQAKIRNQMFGFVFQFYHLLPELSALENVALAGLIANGAKASQIRERAQQLLSEVGLSQRLSHPPSRLSGGEQQRVAIARALINDPKILLCDEPTGNLDPETGNGILQLLIRRNKEYGTALLVVTHEPAVTKLADRVLTLKEGKLWD